MLEADSGTFSLFGRKEVLA